MLTAKKDANQNEDPPILARLIWASSLGIVSIVLLAGGGLGALQTSVLVTGAPFAIIIAIACFTLVRRLQKLI
jgi:choline-glycine betaine transporter